MYWLLAGQHAALVRFLGPDLLDSTVVQPVVSLQCAAWHAPWNGIAVLLLDAASLRPLAQLAPALEQDEDDCALVCLAFLADGIHLVRYRVVLLAIAPRNAAAGRVGDAPTPTI